MSIKEKMPTLNLLNRKPVRWGHVGVKALERDEQKREKERNAAVYRSHEYPELESYRELLTSGRLRLESLESALRYFFEHSPIRLGYMQKKLVDEIIVAFLRKLFGDDLVANLGWLSKKYDIQELNDTLCILFPRRSGKTVAVAIMAAVICVSQPHGNSIMYNLTARQAEEFINEVNKHLAVFKNSDQFGWREVKRDIRKSTEIEIIKFGTSNSVKSYPSALNGDAKIDRDVRNTQSESMTGWCMTAARDLSPWGLGGVSFLL